MPVPRLIVLTLVLPLLTAVSGCGQRADLRSAPPPAAFQPERFPDIPLPPGYVPMAGQDQLAVSYAAGDLRRYHVIMQQVGENALDGDELGDWYRLRLASRGWSLEEDAWPKQQRWAKERPDGSSEQLLLETGRADRRTIIRLVLMPAEG